MELDYTVPTIKSYGEAIQAVQDSAAANGFRVQFVHDVAATLAEKGFEREPVTLVEMCNAKHASAVLAADIRIGLMLPCPVMIYQQSGQVFVSTMLPTLLASFFPEAGIEVVADEVEDAIKRIVDEAAA
jgi:uncharacterized protein (DUF302 family)